MLRVTSSSASKTSWVPIIATGLWAMMGDNHLDGSYGNDNLYSSAGADTLDGGDGYDIVYYSNVSKGVRVDLSRTEAATGLRW